MPAFDSNIPALFHSGPVGEGDSVSLDREETRHARALRLRIGDRIQLLDGKGGRSSAEIAEMEKGHVAVKVLETVLEEPEPGVYIGLAQGILSDKSRMEWIVEKAVELGVGAFYPLTTGRAEGFFNLERARRLSISALKQSQRTWLPVMELPVRLEQLADEIASYDLMLLCHEQGVGRESLADVVRNMRGTERVLLIVGPEGGFAIEEVERVGAWPGTRIVSLGDVRFRSETAAIGALATLRIMNSEIGS